MTCVNWQKCINANVFMFSTKRRNGTHMSNYNIMISICLPKAKFKNQLLTWKLICSH